MEEYIEFHTQIRKDHLTENLMYLKNLRQLVIDNIKEDIRPEIASLDAIVKFFETEIEYNNKINK